jgi:hypothetical protein
MRHDSGAIEWRYTRSGEQEEECMARTEEALLGGADLLDPRTAVVTVEVVASPRSSAATPGLAISPR